MIERGRNSDSLQQVKERKVHAITTIPLCSPYLSCSRQSNCRILMAADPNSPRSVIVKLTEVWCPMYVFELYLNGLQCNKSGTSSPIAFFFLRAHFCFPERVMVGYSSDGSQGLTRSRISSCIHLCPLWLYTFA